MQMAQQNCFKCPSVSSVWPHLERRPASRLFPVAARHFANHDNDDVSNSQLFSLSMAAAAAAAAASSGEPFRISSCKQHAVNHHHHHPRRRGPIAAAAAKAVVLLMIIPE